MSYNKKIGAAVILIAIIFTAVFFLNKYLIIRKINFIINDSISLIETGAHEKIIQYVSADYSDDYGNTYEQLKIAAQTKLKAIEFSKIKIVKKNYITLTRKKIVLELAVLINFKMRELGKLDAFEKFTLYFENIDDGWKIYSIRKEE